MFRILFVSSSNQGNISPIIKSQGRSLENLGLNLNYFGIKGKGVAGYLSNVFKLRSFIKKNNPDIIHAHYSLSGILAALAFSGIPVIVSLMGSDTKTAFPVRQLVILFSRFFWRQTIVKSSAMLKDSGVKKALVIPNGVDMNRFKILEESQTKTALGFSDNKQTILFLANPKRESKNYSLAERAFSYIEDAEAELQVRFNLPQNEIPHVLHAADILLLTSKWEGSPNAVKEAMACNLPVVATNVGDVDWLFGNEPGHFLTSFKPEDVAENLKKALTFSKETGRTNGRNRIVELGLDSESVAKKLKDLYEINLEE